jgi:hypothetical protein
MAGTARAGDHWRLAQRAMGCEADRFEKCRDCRIGAAHAGERHIHRSAIFDMAICPRCRRGGARMIGGRLCVSCYNREREFKIGKNAKGTRPGLVLTGRRLGVMIGYGDAAQRYFEVRDELTEDPLEIAFQVLRLAHGRAAFCKPRGTVAITTGKLARQMGVGREPPRGIIARAAARPGLRKTRRAAPVDRPTNFAASRCRT